MLVGMGGMIDDDVDEYAMANDGMTVQQPFTAKEEEGWSMR